MSDINYCANGCTRRHGDESHRTTTEGKSQLCTQCEARLHDWLTKISDNFALLPTFVMHGTTETNPGSKATKAATVQAPMRLDVIDLLDTRKGRKWNGTEATEDRRGVIGTLQAYCSELIDTRPLTATGLPGTVIGCCTLLERHRLWLAEQDWISDLYDDVRILNRQVSDAIGDYRQKPVGRCAHTPEDKDQPCAGPLYPNKAGGVRCNRCGEYWEPDRLRLLGMVISQQEPA